MSLNVVYELEAYYCESGNTPMSHEMLLIDN